MYVCKMLQNSAKCQNFSTDQEDVFKCFIVDVPPNFWPKFKLNEVVAPNKKLVYKLCTLKYLIEADSSNWVRNHFWSTQTPLKCTFFFFPRLVASP